MASKVISFIAAGALMLGVTACAENGQGNKQVLGGAIGAAVGGLLGSKVGGGSGRLAATAAGAVAGLLIGSEIGKSLDKTDRLYAAQTAQTALETKPSGVASSWSNPDSGHSGTVTPQRTYQTDAGQYCREYQQEIQVGGRTETAYGTACRQPDGSWKIVNS